MKTKAKISFIEFLRPCCHWPYPYTLEQAFEVFRWMVKTGAPYGEFRERGPLETLSGKPTCIGFSRVEPITSIEDLRKRFHYALLDNYGGKTTDSWRENEKIDISQTRILRFKHDSEAPCLHEKVGLRAYERDTSRVLHWLFSKGQSATLSAQLNSTYRKARECRSVVVHVLPAAFVFELKYGIPGINSSWTHELASGEPFNVALWNAANNFCELFDGDI